MNSTMLSYVAFCCLNIVNQCNVNEFRNKIISLNNSKTCLNREFVNLSLPTKWTGCKWSCLGKGFEAIRNLKPNSRCAEKIKDLNKRYTQIKRKEACKPVICNAMCDNSTSGDMGKFFSEAIEHLQAVTRENMRSISN